MLSSVYTLDVVTGTRISGTEVYSQCQSRLLQAWRRATSTDRVYIIRNVPTRCVNWLYMYALYA